tara:strand:+ start:3701 stop:3847 length:147 start_codon:yes stop_codon:yes gene_type:complete
MEDLLIQMIEEQRKTNELLLTLIEALGEEESEDPDAQPETYMDGTKIR